MESKKQARTLQKAAKEFGYEIKLTHAQEILAQVKGFENRHALFKNDSLNQSSDNLSKKDNNYYYEIRIRTEQGLDYLKYLCSTSELEDPPDVATEAVNQNILDDDEWNSVYHTKEISKTAYNEAISKIKEKMFYYEVHVFLSRKEGYSKYFSSNKRFHAEEEIISEAIKQNILDDEDARYVDYTEELPESEYKEIMNYK